MALLRVVVILGLAALCLSGEINFEKEIVGEKLTRDGNWEYTIIYKMGERKAGDKVDVAIDEFQYFKGVQDYKGVYGYNVDQNLTSPDVLTHILVTVTQSNIYGRAEVLKGGLGQRYLQFSIESLNTTLVKHVGSVFGYVKK